MARFVLPIALLAVVPAGCGGGGQPRRSAARGVPRGLAQDWADQASAIAIAASAGDDCRALRLATSLRDAVVLRQRKLPFRLRSPLLSDVKALAGRLTCTPVQKTPAPPRRPPGHKQPQKPPHKPPPPKPPHKPPHHHPDDHGHHGPGDDQGKDN